MAQVVTRLTGNSRPFVRQLLPRADQIFEEFEQLVDTSQNVISFFESTGMGFFNHVSPRCTFVLVSEGLT